MSLRQLRHDLTRPRRAMGYLSVPMSAPTALSRQLLRFAALATSTRLWEAGILHYCPPANGPAIGSSDLPYEYWMAMDLEVLKRCDWILMGEGWEDSHGCVREFNLAMNIGIPVLFTLQQAADFIAPFKGGRRHRRT